MIAFICIAMIILLLVGAIWLGTLLEHLFLVPLGIIIAFVIIGKAGGGDALVVAMIIGASITLIALIWYGICLIRENQDFKKREEIEARQRAEQEQRNKDLLEAVKNGDKESAKKLLDEGADADHAAFIASRHRSALQLAVENRDKDMVLLLLEKGAEVNLVYEKRTALDFAEDVELRDILKSHDAKTQTEIAVAEEAASEEAFGTGFSYFHGDGVAQDYEKAVEWYKKAADLGNAKAQSELAICYSCGLGVEKNRYTAYEWAKKSAEQGYANGQYVLGCCYNNGDGVNQNFKKAVEWYTKSAEQGFAPAQNALGNCYYHGRGLDGSFIKAGEWWEKAATQGNEDALKSLREICSSGFYTVRKIENEAFAKALGIL